MKPNKKDIKDKDIKLLWGLTKDALDLTKKELRTDIKGLEGRFDGLETRFDGLEGRFESLENRFDEFQGDFEKLQGKVDIIGSLVANTHQEVKNFTKLHEVLDSRVAELERRVDRLEERAKL